MLTIFWPSEKLLSLIDRGQPKVFSLKAGTTALNIWTWKGAREYTNAWLNKFLRQLFFLYVANASQDFRRILGI
jgi:hypothetical protein